MKWRRWLELWGFEDRFDYDAPIGELEAELDQWFNDTGSSESDFELQGFDIDQLHRVECEPHVVAIDLETGIPIGAIDYEQWLSWWA